MSTTLVETCTICGKVFKGKNAHKARKKCENSPTPHFSYRVGAKIHGVTVTALIIDTARFFGHVPKYKVKIPGQRVCEKILTERELKKYEKQHEDYQKARWI